MSFFTSNTKKGGIGGENDSEQCVEAADEADDQGITEWWA
jgi:hypothetical protein